MFWLHPSKRSNTIVCNINSAPIFVAEKRPSGTVVAFIFHSLLCRIVVLVFVCVRVYRRRPTFRLCQSPRHCLTLAKKLTTHQSRRRLDCATTSSKHMYLHPPYRCNKSLHNQPAVRCNIHIGLRATHNPGGLVLAQWQRKLTLTYTPISPA